MSRLGIRKENDFRNTSINLNSRFTRFIDKQIQDGRYDSESEMIRMDLRLLEEHELKVKRLEAALEEGLMSGDAEEFDVDSFLLKKQKERGL